VRACVRACACIYVGYCFYIVSCKPELRLAFPVRRSEENIFFSGFLDVCTKESLLSFYKLLIFACYLERCLRMKSRYNVSFQTNSNLCHLRSVYNILRSFLDGDVYALVALSVCNMCN